MRIQRVAITGGIGAGKTHITNMFEAMGVSVIDADVVSRKMRNPCSPELQAAITAEFGECYILPDGTLNKEPYRELLFSKYDDHLMCYPNVVKSNAIFHPLVAAELKKQEEFAMENTAHPFIITAIPLLFECGWEEQYDFVVTVMASKLVRTQRVMARDNIPAKTVRSMMAAQTHDDKRIEKSDFVILNNGGECDAITEHAVRGFYEAMKQVALRCVD